MWRTLTSSVFRASVRAEFSTSPYLAVDELLRAGASRPVRTRGVRGHAPVEVMNEYFVEPRRGGEGARGGGAGLGG